MGLGITTLLSGGGAMVTYFGFTESRSTNVEYIYLSKTSEMDEKIDPQKNTYTEDQKQIIAKKSFGEGKDSYWKKPYYYTLQNPPKAGATSIYSEKDNWDSNNKEVWLKTSDTDSNDELKMTWPKLYKGGDEYSNYIKVSLKLGVGRKNAFTIIDNKGLEVKWALRSDFALDRNIFDITQLDETKYNNKKLEVIRKEGFDREFKKLSKTGFSGVYSEMIKGKDNVFTTLANQKQTVQTTMQALNDLSKQYTNLQKSITNRWKTLWPTEKTSTKKLIAGELGKTILIEEPLNSILHNEVGKISGEGENSDYLDALCKVLGIELNVDSGAITESKNNEIKTNIDKSREVFSKNIGYINSRQLFLEEIEKTNTLFYVTLGLAGLSIIALFLTLSFFIVYTTKKNKEEYGDTEELDYLLL